MVAVSVLLVGLAAYTSLATTTLAGGTVSRRVNAAAILASDKMEALRAEPYADLSSGSDTASLADADAEGASGASGATYARTWTVSAGPTANTKRVTVEVAASAVTGAGAVSLETIVFDW